MTLAVLSYPAIQDPTEPLNRMRGEVEPWFCPEMPGAACLSEPPNRGENMTIIMLCFLEAVSTHPRVPAT